MKKHLFAFLALLLLFTPAFLSADTFSEELDLINKRIEQTVDNDILFDLYGQRALLYANNDMEAEAYQDFYERLRIAATASRQRKAFRDLICFFLFCDYEGAFKTALYYADYYVMNFPGDEHAYLLRADVYRKLNMYSEALKDYEQVEILSPDCDKVVEFTMGMIELHQYVVTKDNAYHSRAALHLSHCQEVLLAEGLTANVSESYEAIQAIVLSALCQIMFDELDSLENLETVSNLYPNLVDALFLLSVEYYFRNDYDSFLRTSSQIVSTAEAGHATGMSQTFTDSYLEFYLVCMRISVSQYYAGNQDTSESLRAYHENIVHNLISVLNSRKIQHAVSDAPSTVEEVREYLSREEICERLFLCYWDAFNH